MSTSRDTEAAPPQELALLPMWALLARLLPTRRPRTEWYTPRDIAALVGLRPHTVMGYARELWPEWEGHYRLDRDQAEELLQRICSGGRKLPDRASVERMVAAKENGQEMQA